MNSKQKSNIPLTRNYLQSFELEHQAFAMYKIVSFVAPLLQSEILSPSATCGVTDGLTEAVRREFPVNTPLIDWDGLIILLLEDLANANSHR
jgi:hypothetical protein